MYASSVVSASTTTASAAQAAPAASRGALCRVLRPPASARQGKGLATQRREGGLRDDENDSGCGGCDDGNADAVVPMDVDGPSRRTQSRTLRLEEDEEGEEACVARQATAYPACGDGTSGAAANGPFGWPSLDLQRPELDLGALAATLPGVDCSVSGVSHLEGGSRAGYARWEAWRRSGGVARYAATRNDAMQRSGTSRMSPYLHWG
ncbi:hypothetical protein Vretimale_13611, partial [Volvox reticuliferus]